MATYGLNPDGFTIKSFNQIRSEVTDYQRTNIDAGLVLSDDDSGGQALVSVVNQLAELWENLQALHSSMDPDQANDWTLVQRCKLTGTRQNAYSKTVVRDVEVVLNPGKSLPAGSVANLTNRTNSRFVSLAEVPATDDGGVFTVDFEAVDAGATSVAPAQLSEIAVAVSGWTAVNNTLDGETGSEPESDPLLREKRERELQAAGSGSLAAIIADVSRLGGVVDVGGAENTTRYLKNSLPRNCVHIIVRGGTPQEIADQIYASKSGGVEAFGSTLLPVTDSEGEEHAIRYTSGVSLTFFATAVLQESTDWNDGTEAEVETAIVTYVNGLGLGHDVVYDKVRAYCNVPEGVYKVVSLVIDFVAPPASEIDLPVAQSEFAEAELGNIDISWTT